MQQPTESRNGQRRRAITEGALVFVILAVWLVPSACAIHEGHGSIVAAAVYGATYGVLVNTLAIQRINSEYTTGGDSEVSGVTTDRSKLPKNRSSLADFLEHLANSFFD